MYMINTINFLNAHSNASGNGILVSGRSRISRRGGGGGIVVHSCARRLHKILEAMSTLGENQLILRQTNSPSSSINLFLKEFLLKHSKVSHSSSFLVL